MDSKKRISKDFGIIIGKEVNNAGNVNVDGRNIDMFEKMKDLSNCINEYADDNNEVVDFAIDFFGPLTYNDKNDFGKKIDTYLKGIDFHIYENKINKMDNENTGVELEQKLIGAIETHLELCDSVETPTICAMNGEAEGHKKLVALIIKKVVVSKMEIPDAIIAIENEYNSNSLD